MSDSQFILIGIGGAGGKVVNTLAETSKSRIKAVAIDTDFDAVARLNSCQQYRIGSTRFGGLGAGGDRSGAAMAADETPALSAMFDGVQVAAVVAGISKGTGAGVLPKILARAAERNVVTLVFMIAPFQFEGVDLGRKAAESEQSLAKLGDLRIICRNDDLCPTDSNLTLAASFAQATQTLADGITLLWKMTTCPGYLNLDFATLIAIVKSGRGLCNLGVGVASGPTRVKLASEQLLGNTGMGLGNKLTGAKAALVGIIGGADLRLKEVADTMSMIGSAMSIDSPIRMGTVVDHDFAESIHLAVLLFREWNPLYASDVEAEAETETAASPAEARGRKSGQRYTASSASARNQKTKQPRKVYNDKFQNSAATCVNGENLDKPTFLRLRLHLDLS